jgi:cardiolipin synthase
LNLSAVNILWVAGGLIYLLSLSMIPRLVLSRRDSAATMSWILTLTFVPIVGFVAYWVFGETRLKRYVRKRRITGRAVALRHETYRDKRACPEDKIDPKHRNVAQMITKISESPPIPGNAIRLFIDPDEAAEAMLRAIDAAVHSVHFEVYIFKTDESGALFREKLVSAAKRGVKVRLLVDAMGTFLTPWRFLRPIIDAGGEVAKFLPISLWRGLYHANLRNHRKILVVDGKVGFTGGLNVGNEYGGWRRRRFGPWRDTHVELKGPAVAALQDVFVEDWHFTTGKEVEAGAAFPTIEPAGPELVHVVASGPDCDWEVIHHAIFTTITQATDHIYLTTPYFVPDRAFLVALETAALRGVDVRVLLPARSDHGVVRAAGRFHYEELLRSGIRIFEYGKEMIHAKTVEVDGRWSTIGSANLDLRSFRLNFELNIVVYGEGVAADLRRVFLRDLEGAREVTDNVVRAWPLRSRFAHASARLVEALL